METLMERLAKKREERPPAEDLTALPMVKREHAHEGETCGCGESEGDGCGCGD
jgi:hypothetical protein